MTDPRRNPDKIQRKDQQGPRETRDEVGELIDQGSKPLIEQPNRDRARGDWDRSGVHHDEEV